MRKTFLFLMTTLLLCIGSSAFNDIKAQEFNITYGEGDAAFTLTYTPLDGTTCSVKCTSGNGPNANTEITIPENVSDGTSTYIVTTIPESGFKGASSALNGQEDNFTKLVLPNTITSIGTYAFYGWENLAELYLGTSINDGSLTIGANAFNNASKISKIYCYYKTPPSTNIGSSFNYTVRTNATVYVPQDVYSSYINISYAGETINWSGFSKVEEISSQDPITLIPSSYTITTCDKVTFTVMQGEGTGTDVTTSATIYQVDGTETIELDGNTFTPSEAGEYTFYAKKGSVPSENRTINVTEAPYVLKASPTNIMADGEDITTFSVTQCGNTVEGFTFYVNGNEIDGNTFSTAELGEYTVYATNGDITTSEITIYATEWKVTGWVTDLVLTEYYTNGDRKYEYVAEITNGVFTLWIALTDSNYDNGIILNNNVYSYETEIGQDAYTERSGHRPTTPQPLSIPETIYVEGFGKVTITEIANNVFYNTFIGGEGFYTATGNSLNNNISSLTIPSTITTLGINAFGFNMSDNFVITCNAETPPTIQWAEVQSSNGVYYQTAFGDYSSGDPGNYGDKDITNENKENISTYLYVPASSLTAYKEADFWKYFYRLVADPGSMIVYNGDGDWTNEDNWSNGEVPADDEIVMINGNVEVSTDVTIGDITINEGCSITIVESGIFHINGTVTNNSENIITIKDGGQLYSTNDVTVTVEKNIIGYGDDDNVTEGWYAISSPVNSGESNDEGYYYENIDNIVNLIPSEGEERKYDLYRYYEGGYEDENGTWVSWWENHKMNNEDSEDEYYDFNNPEFTTLSSGRGYLYASSKDVTLEFTDLAKSSVISFLCTASYSGEDENFIGFNLMGNPFTHNITAANMSGVEMADAYYTLSYSGMWTSNLFSNKKEIKVGEAFLIKVTEESALKFTHETTRSNFINNGSINIVVSNDRYTDNAIVSFSEGKGLNKFPHLNKEAHEVYVIDNDTKYGVATMNDDVTTIPVGFKANTMGEYTISAEAKDCKFNSMTLTDKMTGVKTNLLTDSYTFMATTNDNPNRFTLTLNADNDTDNDFIYINNNEMIINNIEGDGLVQIYDVMGRSVATYNVSGSANISMETLSEGVYIVRMIDANGVKTQKVVNN
ncbi:MAG: T9SS type A sorting domain-containing protein [Bacteroidales bacterium]|nr:T9SS type A sorting domain-containing protein [Bacteroidales bacterium]